MNTTIAAIAETSWLFDTRFDVLRHHISLAGVAGFIVCLLAGLGISSALQSERARALLARLRIERNLANIITSLLSMVAFGGLLVLGIQAAGIPIPWTSRIPGLGLTAEQIIDLMLWVAVVIWLSSASKSFVLKRFLSNSGMDASLQYTLSQVIGYAALGLGMTIAIQNAGINLSALAVFAGAAGVGIGLGFQTISANFISGLLILAERPIKIGDRITVDGMTGQVQAIRVRATTIVNNDNIAVIIPNSRIISNTVTNWSYGSPAVRFRFPVVVAYGSDVDKVREALMQAATEHKSVLKSPPPSVVLEGFAENLINFEMVVWTEEMSYRPQRLRSDLNFAIERRLREWGVGKFKMPPQS